MDYKRRMIRIDGDMDQELLDKFVEDLNNTPSDVDKIYVYFTSAGGQIWVAQQLLDIFRRYSDKVEVIFGPDVHSAAFEVLYKYNGMKSLTDDAFAVLHAYNKEFSSRNLLDKQSFESWDTKERFKKMLDDQYKMFSEFLTDKEVARIKQGKEVYISNARLREIIEKTIKQKGNE